MVKVFSLFMINLRTAMRYKVNFIASSLSLLVPVLPALLLLLNGNIAVFGFDSTVEYTAYLFIATTVWSGVETIWSFTFQMRNQMREGILDETLMQPLSVSQLILGFTSDGIISTILQSVPLLIVSFMILLTSQSFIKILMVLLLVLATYLCGFCMAVILVAIMLNWRETDQLVSFIANIAPFICGVIIPLTFIPTPLKYLGVLFPFTWALDIIRYILFGTEMLLVLPLELAIFIAMILFYYFLGMKLFKVLYNVSRKKGGVVGF